MDGVQLSREALYELVWSEPLHKVARRFQISDVMLAKYCKKMEVPRPGRGYWQRLAAGQPLPRPPLPEPKNPSAAKVCVIRGSRRAAPTAVAHAPKPEEPPTPVPDVRVEPTLTAPHEFIRKTRAALERTKPSDDGVLRAPFGEGILDVAVSRASMDRALGIMDALIKAVEARGGRVRVQGRGAGPSEPGTFVEISGQKLGVRMRERLDRTPHTATPEEKQRQKRDPWMRIPDWDYTPSGRLALEIRGLEYLGLGLRKQWVDTSTQRLEGCLGKFILGLEKAARAKQAYEEEQERRRREWAEEERRRALERLKREQEQARRQALIQEANTWATAERIRLYASAVEQRAQAQGLQTGPDSPLGRWLTWARSVADRLNPLPKRLVGAEDQGSDAERSVNHRLDME